ncbi:hypothetical protein E1A91_A03G095900v1 [Gossypium mustelinum]|uniref:Uncharacterized protein n=1 Tax=Gossypium mustelinum TaxID=34275 RepID=A0A5D2ZXA5_GOSMU|nr:hypothetical protein E1A91_A03G095900v1 [Gossypium mustelinum]
MSAALPSTVLCYIAVNSPLLRRVNSNQKFLTAVLFAETKKFW